MTKLWHLKHDNIAVLTLSELPRLIVLATQCQCGNSVFSYTVLFAKTLPLKLSLCDVIIMLMSCFCKIK